MATNKIPNWGDKINAIVSETHNKKMKIIKKNIFKLNLLNIMNINLLI